MTALLQSLLTLLLALALASAAALRGPTTLSHMSKHIGTLSHHHHHHLLPRVNTCDPPNGRNDATYSVCVLPVDATVANDEASIAALKNYLVKKMGCKESRLAGITNRPIGTVKSGRCTHPGPDDVREGVQGWTINSDFWPAACTPGAKCL